MARLVRKRRLYWGGGLLVGLIIVVAWFAFHIFIFPSPPLKIRAAEERPAGTGNLPPAGWHEARDAQLSPEQKAAIRKLEGLGYLSGSQAAPKTGGVTVYDKTKAWPGLNLLVSGHAPEALLMDMSGVTLHTWSYDIYRVWPDFKPEKNADQYQTFWRRAWLMPNGDLLAIFERIGLIKLDKHSRLLWAARNRAHHDLEVQENGDIYVLTGAAHINPSFNSKEPIWEDYISLLDSRGRELKRVSVLAALQNSKYAGVLKKAMPAGDILHTNTVEVIKHLPPGKATPLRKGTVLISICNLDLVCAVDMDKKTVYWAESGPWPHIHQHQPTVLASGNLLVLNNDDKNLDPVKMAKPRRSSAVIEYDPASRQVKWSYAGGRDGLFFTNTCGTCQRLSNGNTLITESEAGRVFEVTPDKNIVWEYINPHRAGEKHELIATVFELIRLPENFPTGWLK